MTYEDIRAALDRAAATDPQLRALMKRIRAGRADFTDTAAFSQRLSTLLGKVFSAEVESMIPEERETICKALLRGHYEEINSVLAEVQEALDTAQGLSLTPQRAPYPAERVQQLAHSLQDATVSPETIRRRADTGAANVANAMHDDYIEENARRRNDLGLKCYLNRVVGSGSCKWCANLAGRFEYGRHPDDIFRRHDNCTCTVTFENGRKRQDVWSKRTWDAVDPREVEAQAGSVTVNSQEEARRLEESAASGLTLSGERDIMNVAGRGSGSGQTDSDHAFEKIGEVDPTDRKAVAASLADFEREYRDSPTEHCRVITVTGEVYEVHGDRYTVDTSLLGNLMRGSVNEHNHVTGESQYSFSWEDLIGCASDGTSTALAFDEKFRYSMIFPSGHLDADRVYDVYQQAKESVYDDLIFNPGCVPEGDVQHETIKRACEKLGIKYTRKSIAR